MVYMIGDYANLDNNGFADLKEMKKAGSTSEVSILAQFSRGVKDRPTKRYHLTKASNEGHLIGDVVADLGRVETSSSETLTDFICWAVENFPASHYMLVMWGHGNGADDDRIPPATRPIYRPEDNVGNQALQGETPNPADSRGIAMGYTVVDGQTVDFLDSCRFKKALTAATQSMGHKIDILGMDACLMSGIEVCYQVREAVSLMVAPEGFAPLDGWPYDEILSELVRQPSMEPTQLARLIVKRYLSSYVDYEDVCVTQSICKLDRCPSIVDAADSLALALLGNLSNPEIRRAVMLSRWQAQSYEGTDYIDLCDFCNLLIQNCENLQIKATCETLINFITSGDFVVESVYRGVGAQYSYGLSIYFPLTEVSAFYKRLDFAQHTHWIEFLKEFQLAIARPERIN